MKAHKINASHCLNDLTFETKQITMKKNMGSTDRIVRLIIAAIAAILYFTGIISGTLGIVLMIIAVIFALTGFISFCPIYFLLGLRTNRKNA